MTTLWLVEYFARGRWHIDRCFKTKKLALSVMDDITRTGFSYRSRVSKWRRV